MAQNWEKVAPRHLEDLVTFLQVARAGQYSAAARLMQITRSTATRRIRDLEKIVGNPILVSTARGLKLSEAGEDLLQVAERAEALMQDMKEVISSVSEEGRRLTLRISAPEIYACFIASPALARLQACTPNYNFEITSVTQRARKRRHRHEIEVVVGKPFATGMTEIHLRDYRLQLFATSSYLNRHGPISDLLDLKEHRLIYYIGSEMKVDSLGRGTQSLPSGRSGIRSTSVMAQLTATTNDAGIGLLPDYLGTNFGLTPILADQFAHEVSYWAIVSGENLKRAAVRSTLKFLKTQIPTTLKPSS